MQIVRNFMIDSGLLERLDDYMRENRIKNRSQLITTWIVEKLEKLEKKPSRKTA